MAKGGLFNLQLPASKPTVKMTDVFNRKPQWLVNFNNSHPAGNTKSNSSGGGNKSNKAQQSGAPIDTTGRLDLSQLAADRLNFLDQYNQQLSDINRNYGVQKQHMLENEPYAQRGILSNYAGRGMAFGSGYATAAGRQSQLFNQSLNDLDYQHTYGLQDLNTQRLDYMRSYNLQQQAVRQAAADRLAAQAGTLGLSGSKPKATTTAGRIGGLVTAPSWHF